MTLWGGRFRAKADAAALAFNSSLSFDHRLVRHDIRASQAWARALGRAGVLADSEVQSLVEGLGHVGREWAQGTFETQDQDEDIHTAVERRLGELLGPVAGKLHTGRSRNDQVATDFRLWVRDSCRRLSTDVAGLQRVLLASAEEHPDVVIPGFTHMQPAQPVIWGHWILAPFWALERDQTRLTAVEETAAILPLGSGALAGTAVAVDRRALAAELGFRDVSANSIDAVGDRDFATDFLYAGAVLGLHLSRLAEALVFFAGPTCGLVELDEAYCTGSSLMPQKRNPDVLELTRGKAGRLVGNLTGLLATLKGLPSAYDKDLQEDKEPVFDTFHQLRSALPVVSGVVATLRLREDHIAPHLDPAMLATDLAGWLVGRGVPFREAHQAVGEIVRRAEERGVALTALTVADLRAASPVFDETALKVLDWQLSVASRASVGGTAPAAVASQLDAARRALEGREMPGWAVAEPER